MVTNHVGAYSTRPALSPGREAVTNVSQRSKQAAATIGGRAEDAAYAVGHGLQSLAETIRAKGPREGAMGGATSCLADGLEQGGKYLQQKGLSGMAEQATNCMRRNPVPVLLVGLGLGCFLARLTARS